MLIFLTHASEDVKSFNKSVITNSEQCDMALFFFSNSTNICLAISRLKLILSQVGTYVQLFLIILFCWTQHFLHRAEEERVSASIASISAHGTRNTQRHPLPSKAESCCSASKYNWEKTGLGARLLERREASMELCKTSSNRVVFSCPA